MRYMINMDYSNDLPINTLGRRIRTRLYFTSESHLHTLLNVLRFQSTEEDSRNCLLSKSGRNTISKAPELCYLTQIIIRLFENPTRNLDDPKRFRIEILFSPGATATPLHMAEMDRDLDSSRFDCKPLELISKENLSCAEVEEYFSESINQGETMDDEDLSLAAMEESKKEILKKLSEKPAPIEKSPSVISISSIPVMESAQNVLEKIIKPAKDKSAVEEAKVTPKEEIKAINEDSNETNGCKSDKSTEIRGNKSEKGNKQDTNNSCWLPDKDARNEIDEISEKERVERMARRLARRYIIRGVATISLVVGVGCLIFARRLQDDFRIHRRYTKR